MTVQVFLNFAAFALGVVAGYFAVYLREWYVRPKLEIIEGPPMFGSDLVKHVLIVRNLGKTVARNVVAALQIDVSRQDLLTASELDEVVEGPGSWHIGSPLISPTNFRIPRGDKLCWEDIGNPLKMDINPGLHAGLSTYRVTLPSKEILIPTEQGWAPLKMVLRPRKYRATIVVSGENAQPREVRFDLEPGHADVKIKITYNGPLQSWPF